MAGADAPLKLLVVPTPVSMSALEFTLVLNGSLTLTAYLDVGGGVSGAEGRRGEGICRDCGGSASSSSPSSGEELLSCLFVGRTLAPGGGVDATRLLEL